MRSSRSVKPELAARILGSCTIPLPITSLHSWEGPQPPSPRIPLNDHLPISAFPQGLGH